MHNNNVENVSRVEVFDFLRIILTALVVNFHIRVIVNNQPNLLDPFAFYAVPLFLVLSFYFMCKYFIRIKLDYKIIILRMKRILVPFLFWSIIGFITHLQMINIKNIILQLITGQVVNRSLYFLVLLMIFTLIFWMLTYIKFRIRLLVYLSIIFVAFFLQYSFINDNFILQISPSPAIRTTYGRFFELIPYAAAGILLGLLALKTKIKSGCLFFLIILFSLLYVFTINLSPPLGFQYSGIKIFSGTIIVFSLAMLTSGLHFNKKLSKLIEILGRYSFGVYLFHYILLEFLLQLFPHLIVYITRSPFLFMIFYVFLCYGLCILFDILTRHKLSFLIE